MENNQNNNSIFLTISNILKGNRKDVLADLSQRNLLTNTPAVTHQPPTISDTVEQKQQDFLDIQSLKVAQDLYSRQIYFNADRISAINDFRAMDQSPEISVALDIMADECIAFDTVIPLLNGEKSTVEQLFNEKKSNFWVYSYNIEKKCMEPALCERIAYKGKQNVYKVIFDDNSFVKVTDEHL